MPARHLCILFTGLAVAFTGLAAATSAQRTDARLGPRLVIQLQLPDDATDGERDALIGRPFGLIVKSTGTSGLDSTVRLPTEVDGIVEEGLTVTFGELPDEDVRYRHPADRSSPEGTLSPFYVVSLDWLRPTLGATETVVFQLERGIRLRGRVVDEHGVPYPGATVKAYEERIEERGLHGWRIFSSPSTICREDGSFEFNALQPKIVQLSVHAYGLIGQVLTGAELAIVIADPEDIELTVRDGTTLHGRVLLPDGRPLVDASVRLTTTRKPQMWAHQSAKTDAEGRFAVTGFTDSSVEISLEGWLREGSSTFNADKEGQRLLGSATVLPGETSLDQPVTIALAAARVLRGRVIDPLGQPLTTCHLFVGGEHLVSQRDWFATRTSALGAKMYPVDQVTGEFEVDDIPGGQVGIFAQLGIDKHPRSTALVSLHHTELPERLELVLDVLSSIEGVARSADGEALANVQVYAMKIGRWSRVTWCTTRSDSNGAFQLVDLPDGQYELAIDDRNLVTERPVEVDVALDRPPVGDVVVSGVAGGFVQVDVDWPEERDQTSHRTQIFDRDGEWVRTDRTSSWPDDRGHTLLGPILPGEYMVVVTRSVHATRSTTWMRREVKIIAGSPALTMFVADSELTAVVTGLANDVNERPLQGYTVAAKRGDRQLASARIDVNGCFSLSVQGSAPVTIELSAPYSTRRLTARRVDLIDDATVAIELTLPTGEIHGFMDTDMMQIPASGTIIEVVPEGEDVGIRVEGRSVRVGHAHGRGFRILHLAPGTYTLVPWRRAPGELMERSEPAGEPQRITIEAGEKRRDIVLVSFPVSR